MRSETTKLFDFAQSLSRELTERDLNKQVEMNLPALKGGVSIWNPEFEKPMVSRALPSGGNPRPEGRGIVELNETKIDLNDIEACLNYYKYFLSNLAKLWYGSGNKGDSGLFKASLAAPTLDNVGLPWYTSVLFCQLYFVNKKVAVPFIMER